MPISLTASERKLILDLLYARMVQIGEEYQKDGIDRRTQRRLRAVRKHVVQAISKLEAENKE